MEFQRRNLDSSVHWTGNDSAWDSSGLRTYMLFSEQIRGEPRFYTPKIWREGKWEDIPTPEDYRGTKREARDVVENHAREAKLKK